MAHFPSPVAPAGAVPAPKRTVLLASVLKPVDDPRMREKFAATLAAQPGTRVLVAGRAASEELQPEAGESLPPAVVTRRIFWGSRLGWNRLAAQRRYWRLLHAPERPDVVVVHAPELLPLTLLWHWRRPQTRPFVYDIRENYALNITSQGVYPRWLRGLLAGLVRRVETAAARRAAALVLAEKSYADELPFLAQARRVEVLENKYQPAAGEALPAAPRPRPAPPEPLRLLFSGTLSELNGVLDAVALTHALRTRWPGGARLTVVGFCQRSELLAQLQKLAAENPDWLTLVGGAELVPHARIVAEIGRAHLGLLPYRPHPSTWRCRPTKLFEYLAHALPVLVPPNPLWANFVHAQGAGLAVDFAQPAAAAAAVAAALPVAAFYPHGPPAAEVLWAGEAKKLWHMFETLP